MAGLVCGLQSQLSLLFWLIVGLDRSHPVTENGGSFLIDGSNIIRTLHYE